MKKKSWDNKRSRPLYFRELFRVSQKQIIFGGNYYGLKGGYLVWDKLNGETDQFGCEMAWLSFTDRTDMVYYMWRGMMQGSYVGRDIRKALIQKGDKSKNEDRIHVTQKPVMLYDYILSNYNVLPGENVLDTHMGSQSLRISCEKRGVNFYGFEIDRDYFRDGNQRYENYKKQLVLF